MKKKTLKFGLIGAGFIGRTHALAIHAARQVFPDLEYLPAAHMLCEVSRPLAEKAARNLGFEEFTDDWRKLVDAVDAVVVAVPSHLHLKIAFYSFAAGKHVLCEKPVGLDSQEVEQIRAAARQSKACHAVGFTYARAPMVMFAKRMVDDGKLGRLLHFSGRHDEDYLADPNTTFGWRQESKIAGRFGVLGDLGYHILSVGRLLCGEVTAICGLTETFYPERRDTSGTFRVVENEDYASFVARFTNGAAGSFESSRVARGSKQNLSFELVGEAGAIRFSAERLNEMQFYSASDGSSTEGFRKILISAAHKPYDSFIPAPGHGLGFNDLKTIEIAQFINAIAEQRSCPPDLDDAYAISNICEAVLQSNAEQRWVMLRPASADDFARRTSVAAKTS
jgi:predicted dehydrogenase